MAWNIGSAEHTDHAGRGPHGIQIERVERAVSHLTHADRQMQRAFGQRQVIDVTRCTADMTLGTFVFLSMSLARGAVLRRALESVGVIGIKTVQGTHRGSPAAEMKRCWQYDGWPSVLLAH